MEAYDDYSEGNDQTLIDFADKTFNTEGVKKLFIACTIIMFIRAGGAKPRYYCDRERLEDIVLAGKEKTGDKSYLQFFVERINREKGVSKYFNGLFEDPDFDKYVDLLLGYLKQFGSDFVREIRREVNKKVTNKEDKTTKAREFCSKVKELANECDLPFFVVTDGASAISNNGCEAVKNARDNHIKWELEHNADPYEDWSEEEK
jgi:hypothetical protein